MKLYAILESVLKSESNNIITTKLLDNQGDLMLNKIHDLIDKTDENLIGLLLENKELREKFFIKIKDVYVFKTNDFKFFLDENKIDNSYTQYENRIGLTACGKFLKDSSDVVLDFPYKDCILEGGQSTEEGTDTYFEYDSKDGHYLEKQAKRKEIFFNTVLAKDEIDRLIEPKAFSNIKKYTTNGEENITSFERDEKDTIKDNLIIKGNNLLALHTLKSEFAGKVKLIYIDPPYNTGNDSFAYNDNFNHSTWLTFMRNRLLVAKELLREDGSIFISLDDSEAHYAKVLCDEIFNENNFLSDIIWNSTKSVTNTAIISVSHTHNLVYFKNKDYFVKNRLEFRIKEDGEGFSNPDNDFRGVWKADPFQVGGWRPNQQYEITNPNTGVVYKPNKGASWKNDYVKFQKLLEENRIIFGTDGKSSPQRKRFLSEALERGKVAKTLWTDLETTTNGTQHLKQLFKDYVFSNPKPEGLIQRIIELATKENDIILDYHLGSGTTASTAHKMKRQYIGVEQMNYIETVSVERLKKVIDGEQGGISKSVNWQGGGSFVYLELAKNNQNAIEHIQSCESYQDLAGYFDVMCDKYFLHYNVKVNEFREVICKEENFKKLTLDQQKIMFAKMLDLNQLYVNVSDMEDSRYALSSTDIAVTKDFYQI